ncbi:branched-chain amino acid transaminase [Pseudomonas asiatica]|uniref:branched-chain amino acid transaminase n=1 Tax=Pseudomonas asiatica TaxID=2219225 RepID=UPI00209B3782|nr:branched-chain amino acid transaminase [Pseudomonas asiatica]MCO7524862.1 branched-chain amino acid transaminase [Pseudomonas asiatica]
MSISDRDGKIWKDGELVDWRSAQTHVLTHSLHYGMGIFEGMRAYDTDRGPAIFRLDDHIKRLFNSAKIFQLEIPFTYDQICEASKAVIKANGLGACYLRPLVWLGADFLSIASTKNPVHVATAAWRMGAYLGEEGMQRGIRVKTSSFSRHHVNVSMVRAKASGHYINSILANREVTAQGFDEALLLDTDGYVSEGAGENVFIIKDGVIYTPDLGSCLDGITRNSVVAIAHDHGYVVKEKRITRDEMYCADEAFFTGTAAEVTPIRELDCRVIGAGTRGPITEKIQATYLAAVRGELEQYRHWLSYVD